MENEINILKQIYISVNAPMEASGGYADVLIRLERKVEIPIYKTKFFYIGLVLILIVIISAGIVLTPQNQITKALNGVFQNSPDKAINPSISPIPNLNLNIKKSKKPSPTATPKISEPAVLINPESGKELQNIDEKRHDDSFENDREVKGANTQNTNTLSPTRSQNQSTDNGNSEEHENENSTDNPSSEKSKGKNN